MIKTNEIKRKRFRVVRTIGKTISQNKIWFFLASLLMLFGACSNDALDPDLAQISVEFVWDTKNLGTSPEMTLKNVPQGTVYFKVRMFDLDNRYPHGDEKIKNDNSNIIKPGAIDPYQEPAPMYGSPRYEVTIKAFNQEGKIIGIGKKMRRYPEE